MLSEIRSYIKPELEEFQVRFKNAMRSKVALLDRIAFYIIKTKGKQIRPLTVFLSAKLLGDIGDSTYHAASLVEILHTATLVHDDVVDNSLRRRGFFSINALWKHKAAVLVGDYLFSKGLLLAIENEEYELLHILTNAVREISEGELLQMEKSRLLDIDEGVYLRIIRQKTASMISASFASGAASTGADKVLVDKMKQIGEQVGMAFQIKDDLFDYGSKDIGKPRGIDIKEKKMTLPLIYALSVSDASTRRYIKRIIKKESHKKSKQKEVIEFVHKQGGIDYANDRMRDYVSQAKQDLSELGNSQTRKVLINLIDYVIEREK